MNKEQYERLVNEGVDAWNEWRAKNPEELIDLSKADFRLEHIKSTYPGSPLLSSMGSPDAHVSLRKVRLERAALKSAHLEAVFLQGAHLEEAILIWSYLKGAKLWQAHLEAAVLADADLEEAVLAWSHLEGADLQGADIRKTNVTAVTYKSASFANFLWRTFARWLKWMHAWPNVNDEDRPQLPVRPRFTRRPQLRGVGVRLEGCYGSQRFVRHLLDQAYIEEFQYEHPKVAWIWWLVSDYGRSMWRWALWSIAIAIGFGLLFWRMGEDAFTVKELVGDELSTYLYYSVVTFTTLGFGDVLPKTSWAAFWVAAEVVLGYVMLGGLISIFANKVARRS